jgi:uncharacterized protein YbjT (DUF2867 family)
MSSRHLLVLGATGATGQLVVSQALAAGHRVTALVRSPQKLTTTDANLTVITGQPTDQGDLARALDGTDAVISTLGAMKGTLMTDTTRALLGATGQGDGRPIVVMSTFAAARDRLTGAAKTLTGLLMGAPIKDRAAAEELLRRSGRRHVIAYATRLTNGPATGASVVPAGTRVSMSDTVSRADVAAWLLRAATEDNSASREVVLKG